MLASYFSIMKQAEIAPANVSCEGKGGHSPRMLR